MRSSGRGSRNVLASGKRNNSATLNKFAHEAGKVEVLCLEPASVDDLRSGDAAGIYFRQIISATIVAAVTSNWTDGSIRSAQ